MTPPSPQVVGMQWYGHVRLSATGRTRRRVLWYLLCRTSRRSIAKRATWCCWRVMGCLSRWPCTQTAMEWAWGGPSPLSKRLPCPTPKRDPCWLFGGFWFSPNQLPVDHTGLAFINTVFSQCCVCTPLRNAWILLSCHYRNLSSTSEPADLKGDSLGRGSLNLQGLLNLGGSCFRGLTFGLFLDQSWFKRITFSFPETLKFFQWCAGRHRSSSCFFF